MKKIKCAVCQLKPEYNRALNLNKARSMMEEAAEGGAKLIILPEMFICPYEKKQFVANAQTYPQGDVFSLLKDISLQRTLTVVGGSIPEKDGENLYNSSFVYGPTGQVLGIHRKLHMFDVHLESGLCFYESETITPGDNITVVETPHARLGVAICYDLRFPELFRIMSMDGAWIMVVPAVFNTTTGPAHWELLLRTRAVDNQAFVIGACTAQNIKSSYLSYGNSMIVDPWGNIISRAGIDEDIIYGQLSLEVVDKVRAEMPLLKHRRKDLYTLE